MAKDLPLRPRLSERALPRRHRVDGETVIALHDGAGGGVICLDERAWKMLSCADGTRDLEGIRLAAARAGAEASTAVLADFFGQLNEVGLIDGGPVASRVDARPTEPPRDAEGGVDPDDPSVAEPLADAALDLPLDPLPGYLFTCDNLGSCCRRYGTIIFSPGEAARARAALPELNDCGERPGQMFMPERGVHTDGALAVAMDDGHCAFHEVGAPGEGGRCRIHAVAGAAAKPAGCTLFPRTFVDDGEVVRVSAAVECACVITSLGRADGEPLAPGGATQRSGLSPLVFVETLPERIALTGGASASRAELRAWSRAVVAADIRGDVAAAIWSLAESCDVDGLACGVATAALERAAPLAAESLRPWLAALATNAELLAEWDAQWRGQHDLARRATLWVAEVASSLAGDAALDSWLRGPPPEPQVERFYLRALVHGHRAARAVPLGDALRDLAVRLLVARAFPRVLDAAQRRDVESEHPLALVEAMLRGHGLCDYVEKLVR